ncbi:MAG: hypothetical protein A2513_04410 [Sulfurimonas sp. RIFOXYD12_FULL_33_39]|uniref:hypothetical protein n=1 Tax=unclassified Sulfurimonas TaxID=2623549 RepID=UPI0008B67FF3|nr:MULTISPECIES: hypothetical protein [unclassified Sulfurimonas]OHE09377.1 MAG: hypothetical protein A2513_04410 [Sulfurimonas sp. RIFOXYD12_FULL_33_39]OHE12841.1 MAG: hypothetical protein A2530_04395 [Sulfurimonas sp. RIFOXYD2_FULL_34_21]DAB27340.1 MAG TPA: hypothetical protein CFH78_08420 [Sulfurimonas sp. UBA10385]
MGNGRDNGTLNGAVNETELDIDGQFNDGQDSSKLNRNQLMELTGKELAKMAQPYSTKTLKTLEKTAKAELCDLILGKGVTDLEEKETHARAARTESETEQFISTALMMLSAMKQNRDGEPLNAMASEVFKKQAVVYADDKVKNGQMDINKSSIALLYISGAALLFDSLVGFKNAPGLIQKLKNKFLHVKKNKADDSK